jgi:hypothetical protein
MSLRLWLTGFALGCLLIVITIALLAYAGSWTPEGGPRCFSDIGHSQFPKWLGCSLAVHETLAGSLVAAGGALWGAWLAFSGLQQQIGMARKNEVEAKRLEQEKQVQNAGRDVDLMKMAHGFVENLSDEFPTVGDDRVSDIAFTSRLLDLRHRGSLHLSSNAARAPDGNGDSVTTVIGRLNILANDINEETKTLSADMRPAILRNRDAEVRTQVAGLRDLAQNLAAKILRYEAKFKDVASRKIE